MKNAQNTIGLETVRQYCCAVLDIWNTQKADGLDVEEANPRLGAVKLLIGDLRKSEGKRKRAQFEDPGRGTMLDGYSTHEELAVLTGHFFAQNSIRGLRDRCAILLCHGALLRGDNVRELEMSELQCQKLSRNTGFSDLYSTTVILRDGKTQSGGRVHSASFLRAIEVEACPVNGLAIYLFCNFMMDKRDFGGGGSCGTVHQALGWLGAGRCRDLLHQRRSFRRNGGYCWLSSRRPRLLSCTSSC